VKISLVIPVYNEVESIPHLHKAIEEALDGRDYEVVYVDDGSTDGSVATLESLLEAGKADGRIVVFRRNFGQTAALAAGIDHSSGEVIVTLDADMQNDPADIPALVAKIEEGYDVASGWRVDRQDAAVTRRFPSRVANWLISSVTGVHLHDYGCTLKAYRREILQSFHLYGEMHRFIPAYAAGVGARIVEVPVRHHARQYGRAKYGLERTVKVVLDLITVKFLTSYSAKPIYIFGGTGLGMIAGSVVFLLVLVARRIMLNEHMIRSPLLLLSVMLFILGAQAILMGLLAELTVRTYYESQSKPTYAVRRVIDSLHGAE
jgi:glycosyltransferase involved in cell wall biosynthesis